jgi:hypothetical protein
MIVVAVLILILSIVGAVAARRLKIFGLAILSLAGFAFAGVFAWLLSYSFLSSLIVAFGSSAAIQVGFFSGLLAQIWFGMRSAEMDKFDLPPGKADVLAHL